MTVPVPRLILTPLFGCFLAVALACNRGTPAEQPRLAPRSETLPLIERLEKLVQCQEDGDCADLGYVCSVGCYVPVSRQRNVLDDDPLALKSLIHESEHCHVEEERRTCGRFFGLACLGGRCAHRSTPPKEDLCRANFVPATGTEPERCFSERRSISCETLFPAVTFSFDCHAWCDGKNPLGTRYRGCGNVGDGCPRCFEIDYLRCSTCEAAGGPAKM
jgi:hypothetical protein